MDEGGICNDFFCTFAEYFKVSMEKNIIIAGDGEVGFHLAEMLSADTRNNVKIIDPKSGMQKRFESNPDVMAISGDPTSFSVLKDACIDEVHLFISVVHEDNRNIVACAIANQLGAEKTIARVSNLEYLSDDNRAHFKAIGIDHLVSPESIASKEILRMLRQTFSTDTYDFGDGKLRLYTVRITDINKNIEEGSDKKYCVIGRKLSEITFENPDIEFRAVAILRGGETFVPKSTDIFQDNDMVYLIAKPSSNELLLKLIGKENDEIHNAIIVGGGRIGKITAEKLEKKMNVKLIDIDSERCKQLANTLENTMIINGDATDIKLLEEEDIRNTDAFIAVTRDSETNIFACLLAKKYGVKKVIPLVDNVSFISIAKDIGIESIINKKFITASYIARFTIEANVNHTKVLNDTDAEVLEVEVKSGSKAVGKLIRELPLIDGAFIGGVVRGDEAFISRGPFLIKEGDKLIMFAKQSAIKNVEKLFN